MEAATYIEWILGALFVGVNAYRRYNTPASNRESTTFQNFVTFFALYLFAMLALYVFFGALFDSSPETIGFLYGVLTGTPTTNVPEQFTSLSAPMVSALFLTTLLPSLPLLSRYDRMLLNRFWDRGHIPIHVHKMAASMRRARFNFSPAQRKYLCKLCDQLGIEHTHLAVDKGVNLDFRWARINSLVESIHEWEEAEEGRLRRYMIEHKEEFRQIQEALKEINSEFVELYQGKLDNDIQVKIEKFLDQEIYRQFKACSLFAARAACLTEVSESGRRSLISQLGFEGGSYGRDRLSSAQIAMALLAILVTFFAVSVVQELGKPVEFRRFSSVTFITFLMFFTYGAALVIALNLKTAVSMGYNELTRRRSWVGYVWVGIITMLSWLIVTLSYRYIINMLSGMDSEENVIQVLTSLSWSYPYALQSLALAVSLSWILDYHQSQKMTERLSLSQRVFDVGIATIALALATLATYCWMEGIGWFEGFATKDEAFRGRTSLWWMMAKSVAVSATVGLLVPMWYHLNRIKAPDQIACRLIAMNKRRLSDEIRSLQPDQLVHVVAAVGASVAAIDDDVNINEKDVYQIICSQLAGLRSSDVDVDTAEQEFEHCLELIERGDLDLEQRLAGLNGLPMLSALMPYIASSIAFADGVYQKTEKVQVEKVQQYVKLPDLLV